VNSFYCFLASGPSENTVGILMLVITYWEEEKGNNNNPEQNISQMVH